MRDACRIYRKSRRHHYHCLGGAANTIPGETILPEKLIKRNIADLGFPLLPKISFMVVRKRPADGGQTLIEFVNLACPCDRGLLRSTGQLRPTLEPARARSIQGDDRQQRNDQRQAKT